MRAQTSTPCLAASPNSVYRHALQQTTIALHFVVDAYGEKSTPL